MRILWFLACGRMVFQRMVFAYGLSINMILRFFQWILLRTLQMNLLRVLGVHFDFWAFQILLRSVLSIL